jgi:hypothetical protein
VEGGTFSNQKKGYKLPPHPSAKQAELAILAKIIK